MSNTMQTEHNQPSSSNEALIQPTHIVLQPEQEKVLKLPATGIILVKGVAGSGKTTIALYRAKYLLEQYANMFTPGTVAIFTFNRLLSNYLSQARQNITVSYADTASNLFSSGITISTFHKWAYGFLLAHNEERCKNMVRDKEKKNYIQAILQSHKAWNIASKPFHFLADEISWIKGKLLTSLAEYKEIERVGRGTSIQLPRAAREEMWQLYEDYNASLAKNNQFDFDDYARVCLKLIDENPNFTPPYTHIVVDEAQDLNRAQLLVIKRLVSPDTNSLTVIADSAQRIYKSGFTWSEVGFDFRGNTCVLKRNYRSTIEISRAALSLLGNDPQSKEFTQIEAARRGEHIPIIYKATSPKEQWQYVVTNLPELLREYNSVVLLQKNETLLNESAKILEAAGYSPRLLSKGQTFPKDIRGLFLCTLTSAKGLEFDVVFILDCNEDERTFLSQDGEKDQEHISTERRKLFTAMTRARERLYLLSSRQAGSPFLADIDPECVKIIIP